ncbi:MAG: hypothetical protein PUG79_10695, partial [Mediterraneibacter faecis]|nr:hypothetical protein [Mediterraneibacter faecis]
AANAEKSGGSFTKTNNMAEAFKDADIVYPKSWAPFAAMEKRTELYGNGDFEGIKALEKELLAQNAEHKDWACTEELMATTKDGKALYMHCLPADITGVSCEEGEVDASVFDRYRDPLYKEASYKPYIIAAMEKRTELYGNGDTEGIKALEKELLAQNAEHKDWACTEELMATTKDGKALYMHCLPADISGVSCEEGEVDASVFDRYRDPLYKEASFKPYIIAAMIFLAKFENPQEILKKLEERGMSRIFE